MNPSPQTQPIENSERPMTPEEIILWLEGYRRLMFEIWKENPSLRAEWEKINR